MGSLCRRRGARGVGCWVNGDKEAMKGIVMFRVPNGLRMVVLCGGALVLVAGAGGGSTVQMSPVSTAQITDGVRGEDAFPERSRF